LADSIGGAPSGKTPPADSPTRRVRPHSHARWEQEHPDWFDSTRNIYLRLILKVTLVLGCCYAAYWSLRKGRPDFAAAWLVPPLTILLAHVSFRQYHRYRSEVQALIDGKLDKQRAADEAAQTAAGKKAESAAIDALTQADKALSASFATLQQDVTKRMQDIRDMLLVLSGALGHPRPQTPPPPSTSQNPAPAPPPAEPVGQG
jgi:hypothetical protein